MHPTPTTAPRIILVAALAALAGLSFVPVFGGFGATLLLATFTPPAAVVAWALWARHRHMSPTVAGLGVLVVAVGVAVTTRPGSAVASGPYRLLTEALPADPGGPELATASALTGYAALVSCYLALTRPARLAPVLPPLACLFAGLGLGAATGELPPWYPPAFVALAATQLATARQLGAGRDAVTRTAPRPLAVTAVLVALGVVASMSLTGLIARSGAKPADLRSLIAGPVTPKASTNPFAQFLAMRSGQLSVRITGSASSPTNRLRMITLSEFDGQTWSANANYRRAGHQLPPAPTRTGAREITIDVTVSNPETLGWLPTAGRATAISIADLGVDEDTGDLVVPAGTSTPMSYLVTGAEPVIHGDALLDDEPAPATAALDLDLPPDVLAFATTTTATAPTDSARLVALYRALTGSPFGFDGNTTEAASGHGLFQISALLRDKRGTSEQYASAFALMCRYLGWDARVVLGFRPHWSGSTLTATGEDIHAWTEVRFARLGWVPVDPTPQRPAPGREPDADNAPPPRPGDNPLDSLPDPGQATPPGPANQAGEPARATTGPVPHPTGPPEWVLVTITVSGAIALLLLGTPLAKSVRRARRRRTGSTRTRTVAAWHEALDVLRGTGLRPPHSATTGEIVRTVGNTCPPELDTLAWWTDSAAFAPEEPNEADVLNAWADSDNIRKAIRQHLRIHTRVLAAIDPRPLLPGRHIRGTPRSVGPRQQPAASDVN